MRQSLFRKFGRPDARRELRVIESAMRDAPCPKPAAGLKDRLLADAIAASSDVPVRRAHPRVHLIWASAAVAVVIAVIAVGVALYLNRPAQTPVIVQESPRRVQPREPRPRIAQMPEVPQKVDVERPSRRKPNRFTAEAGPAPRRKWSLKPKSDPVMVAHAPEVAHPEPRVESEVPQMKVTISRSRDGVGYARTAAWSMDESGNAIRTEWELVDDPSAAEPSGELSVTDASGRRQSLTVAVSSDDWRGEQL